MDGKQQRYENKNQREGPASTRELRGSAVRRYRSAAGEEMIFLVKISNEDSEQVSGRDWEVTHKTSRNSMGKEFLMPRYARSKGKDAHDQREKQKNEYRYSNKTQVESTRYQK